MKQANLNKHGQPFSKKQKKASRHMMAVRRGFQKRAGGEINLDGIAKSGILANIGALLFGMKTRRQAS